ncbi:MAG: DUF2279 domain-containing protein [Bacteroidia bacterium]|nr:DUF2279 domain-containing protein [Bacteroidia bacterium]
MLFAAFVALISFPCTSVGQEADSAKLKFWNDARHYERDRGHLVGFAAGSLYMGGMSALYATWYREYPMGKFHFFNDEEEWLQMDKMGHCGSAYYLGRWSSGLLKWTGMPDTKAYWLGTGMSYAFLMTIEVFDGFARTWGFSATDIVANTAGAGLFLTQALAWDQQAISFKFSFRKSPLAEVRPEVFGSGYAENALKDYNGQTYWLSSNISMLSGNERIPSWLNLAVGYGANNMLSAVERDLPAGLKDPGHRYRQFYLSPDIDWSRIKTRRAGVKLLLKVIGFIKVPAPAIEYRSNGKWIFHGLHF